MAKGGYGSDFYRNLELDVQFSGQRAVDNYEQAMHAAERAAAQFGAQLKANGSPTQQQIADFAKLQDAADKATAAFAGAQRAQQGLPAQLNATTGSAKGASQALLELSRGLEDLSTGGFIGILNNLPGIARGIGGAFGLATPQVAALETAVSLLGTASYLLYTHWDKVKGAFAEELPVKPLETIKQMKDTLEELTSKEWKTVMDVRDIERAEAAIDKLTKAEAGYKKLDTPSDAEEARGKAFGEAVKEGAPEGRQGQAIVDALVKIRQGVESPAEAEARKKMADLEAQIATASDEMAFGLARELDALKATEAGRAGQNRLNVVKAAKDDLGAARNGDPAAIKAIQDAFKQNPQRFAAEGFDVKEFGDLLAQASPEAVAKVRKEKEDAKKQAAADKKQAADDKLQRESDQLGDQSAAETMKLVREAVADLRGGVEKQLVQELYDAIKAGVDPAEAQANLRDQLLGVVRQRGVDPYARGLTADQLLSDAAEKAQNHLLNNTLPNLTAAEMRKKAQNDANTQRDVNKHVSATIGGYRDDAEARLYGAMTGGGDVEATKQGLFGNIAEDLAGRGVPVELVSRVADAIIKQVEDRAANAVESGQAPKLIRNAQTQRDAAIKKQVGDLAPGYLPGIENYLAQRTAAIGNGVPVARDAADAQRLARSGEPYLPPAADARRQLTSEVAAHLRRTRQDQNLAAPLVDRGIETYRNKIGRNEGAGIDPLVSAAGIMRETQGHVLQLQKNAAQQAGILESLQHGNQVLRQNNQRLHQATQRARMRRPSLLD